MAIADFPAAHASHVRVINLQELLPELRRRTMHQLSLGYAGILSSLERPLHAAAVGAALLTAPGVRYDAEQSGGSALLELERSGATYLFDFASSADLPQEDRTVAAWALTPAIVLTRELRLRSMMTVLTKPHQQLQGLVDAFLVAPESEMTRRGYTSDLQAYLRWLGDRQALAVTDREINEYRNWMAELVDVDGEPSRGGDPRFAPTTIARRLSVVRNFYAYAARRGGGAARRGAARSRCRRRCTSRTRRSAARAARQRGVFSQCAAARASRRRRFHPEGQGQGHRLRGHPAAPASCAGASSWCMATVAAARW